LKQLRSYLQLTKPTINLLVLITGAAALIIEGSFADRVGMFVLVLLGLFATAGSANAFNQYFEREVDKKMTRTAKKRPLPSGRLTPRAALVFAISCGIFGVALFAFVFNAASALLALSTIAFYSFFYTLYLKPRTHLNIVIGGAAGAMGPVIAWAAAAGTVLAWEPWIMFAIIFFWTPPHFWALAFCLKEDYRTVEYPMMPNVKGDDATMRQMKIYTVVTILTTLSLAFFNVGVLYLFLAVALGIGFMMAMIKADRTREVRASWALFGFSIVYLLALFVGMMVDAAVLIRPWS